MKIRIISALVGMVVLVGVLVCPYTLVLAIVAAALSAIAVWELLYNTGLMKNRVQVIGGMLMSAAGVIFMYLARIAWNKYSVAKELFEANRELLREDAKFWMMLIMALPLVYGVFTGVVWLFTKNKSEQNVYYAFLMPLYPMLGFGCMVMLREIPHLGIWPLLLVLAIAWVSDTGAYFVGTFLGKHKMAPKISPKKSWEGFFGGWLISVLFAVGLFILRFELEYVNISRAPFFSTLYLFLPMVIVLAPLSVVGDLLASLIKRHTGIKDFGNLMPGHGGVMDRFDSVVFIAPLLYCILHNQIDLVMWFTG